MLALFFGAFIPPTEDDSVPVEVLAGSPLILMPLFKNGSLADYITKRKTELEKQNLFGKRQVIDTPILINMAMNAANCIQFLHSRTIIHRDIKPANFLLDDNWVIRVTDFGVSRAMADISTGTYTYTGTEVWMAPEVFNKYYDQKVDTYSFGLVLWSMVSGLIPYDAYNELSKFTDEIIVGGTRETIPDFTPPVHPELSRLICKCWSADPTERPEFSEILDIFYNMKCLITQRPFTHIYDGLEEKEFHQFVELILSYMDSRTRMSFCLTNSKFYPFRVKRDLCM
jgi:serine/threonine protein kinase